VDIETMVNIQWSRYLKFSSKRLLKTVSTGSDDVPWNA